MRGYRAAWEPRPRPVASGHQNIVGLGFSPVPIMSYGRVCPAWGCNGPEPVIGEPIVRLPPVNLPLAPTAPVCPAWGCDGPPRNWFGTVLQPPPSTGVTTVVGNPHPVPISPAPAPVVGVPPTQTSPTLPNPGATLSTTGASAGGWVPNTYFAVGLAVVDPAGHTQQVTSPGSSGSTQPSWNDNGGNTQDGSVIWSDMGTGGAVASSGIGGWLGESSMISGFPNWGILAAAGVAAMFLFGGGGKRR